MNTFEKASIRADVLQSAYNSISWDVSNLKERLDRYKSLNAESDTHDYDGEIENVSFRLSVYDAIEKALEKLL